jgi:large subunit ribosomal protein L24
MVNKTQQKRFSPKLRLKKGDKVIVVAGRDKGKSGLILEMYPSKNSALVEGVNMVTKHQKPRAEEAGEILTKEMPIHLSNLMYAENGEPTRVGRKLVDGKIVRYSKKTGEILD